LRNRALARNLSGCAVIALAIALPVGCVSVPNPFVHMKPDYNTVPADLLKEVALDIERAVQAGEREPGIADREPIVVNTEAIAQAIKMRAARSALVNEFLDTGFGREERNGLIKILHSKEYKKGTTARERDRFAMLVLSENNDRWVLYEGLLKSSRFPSRALGAVQDTFHQARVECMMPGQAYEDASGETVRK